VAETPGPVEILPVHGIPELRPGDDLARLLAAAAPWLHDGDVVVVTSKAVSKAEGRLVAVPADPAGREAARQAAIDAETVRVVAARGRTRIVQTRHGLVLASAGVDASNVAAGELALLPVDPDASAARLRAALRAELGVDVAVVLSDTFGRPWRAGLVDVAIGVAGMPAVLDLRGALDSHGNRLEMTEVALADEVAAAAELSKGKLGGVPVAVVRGLSPVDDPRGSKPLLRPAAEDLFRLGTAEAVELGRQRTLAGTADPGPLHADAVRLVREQAEADPVQRGLGEAFLGFLAARPDAVWRDCRPGHLTASAMIVDPSRDAVLLALHPRIGAWVQLGGHLEECDGSIAAAAAREAAEESGIVGLQLDPTPVDLNVLPVTCSLGVPTRHFDIRFVAVAATGGRPTPTAEQPDVRWFPAAELPADAGVDIPALVARARRRLGLS
jgi:dehydro coenzyme F420 reductase / coenzyme F420-0:L-glutamate ligase / coenzyme F420-1:gamma-L-glutamate ligase